jgi:hypothetical protein
MHISSLLSLPGQDRHKKAEELKIRLSKLQRAFNTRTAVKVDSTNARRPENLLCEKGRQQIDLQPSQILGVLRSDYLVVSVAL